MLKKANAFGAWLKRLAVTVWLQHLRKHDALHDAEDLSGGELIHHDANSERLDLDQALATLSTTVRLCVVLSYHEGASHREIAQLTELPLGTVKSHISRGTKRLRQILSAYQNNDTAEK